MLKGLVTRQLHNSNQLGTSVLFGITNEHNSVCIDNFEQYFETSLLIPLIGTVSVLRTVSVHFQGFKDLVFCRTRFPIWSMAKKRKPGNAGNQRKAFSSKDRLLLTFEIIDNC